MPIAYNGLLFLAAGGFAAMGWAAIAAPQRVLSQFGVEALTADGRNEVRAVYGGFGFAIATVLLVALLNPDLHAGICGAVAAALGGMAGGRILSASIDRAFGRWPLVYFCIETVAAVLLGLVALQS